MANLNCLFANNYMYNSDDTMLRKKNYRIEKMFFLITSNTFIFSKHKELLLIADEIDQPTIEKNIHISIFLNKIYLYSL